MDFYQDVVWLMVFVFMSMVDSIFDMVNLFEVVCLFESALLNYAYICIHIYICMCVLLSH